MRSEAYETGRKKENALFWAHLYCVTTNVRISVPFDKTVGSLITLDEDSCLHFQITKLNCDLQPEA